MTIVQVCADAVRGFHQERARSLSIAGEAEVPLASDVRARFVAFSDPVGETPVAVIVGAPDMALPTPVRLHSACLTGDVFGSRRCDCGDQLCTAVDRLVEMGGGIVLYLPQEGRGLGLANKMRTYQLQDIGFDTVDANTTLGFDDDEGHYSVAARMLEMLGCTKAVLLTNNPAKIDGLAKAGIESPDAFPLKRRSMRTTAAILPPRQSVPVTGYNKLLPRNAPTSFGLRVSRPVFTKKTPPSRSGGGREGNTAARGQLIMLLSVKTQVRGGLCNRRDTERVCSEASEEFRKMVSPAPVL